MSEGRNGDQRRAKALILSGPWDGALADDAGIGLGSRVYRAWLSDDTGSPFLRFTKAIGVGDGALRPTPEPPVGRTVASQKLAGLDHGPPNSFGQGVLLHSVIDAQHDGLEPVALGAVRGLDCAERT